jgi:hypothetical protein
MVQNLEQHINELKKTVISIKRKIECSRKPKLNPYAICVDILKHLKKEDGERANRKFIADKIRKLHDFYGWMSKGCIDENGLCSGAIYRTERYMQIPLNERTGNKLVADGFHRVHIEHSVPINEINKLLHFKIEQLNSPKDVFELIMENSVCTAFSHKEEKSGIRKGFTRKLAYGDQINKKNIFPFERYFDDVKIFNVLTGTPVLQKTSLIELTKGYKEIEIYNWQLLEKHYKD